jgi:hypothetical protein
MMVTEEVLSFDPIQKTEEHQAFFSKAKPVNAPMTASAAPMAAKSKPSRYEDDEDEEEEKVGAIVDDNSEYSEDLADFGDMGDMLSEGETSDKKLKIIEMKKSEPSPPIIAQKSEEPTMVARNADRHN